MKNLPLTFSLCMAFGLVGCGQSSQIQQYVAERENERVFTTDALREEFPVIPFEWTPPKSWEVAENDQFSLVAWTTGPKVAQARITVSNVNAASGVEAQVTRWRGQIGLPPIDDPKELMSSLSDLRIGDVTGTWVELKGGAETILAFLVPLEDKLWVFRYRSSNETAAKEKSGFRTWCESIKIRTERAR